MNMTTTSRNRTKRELYYFDPDSLQSQSTQQLKLTTINQTWFKLLAVVSFACALFVYAALVWLIVCRPNRLPETDEEIKREAAMRHRKRRKRKQCCKRERINFKRRLKYLLFNRMRVRSPSFASSSSDSNSDDDNKNDKKNRTKKTNASQVKVKTVKETSKMKENKKQTK